MTSINIAGVIPVIHPASNNNPLMGTRPRVPSGGLMNSRLEENRRLKELQKLELEQAQRADREK